MKTSLEIIRELIQRLEIFTEENPDSEIDLKSFIIWLNSKLFADEHTDPSAHDHEVLDMELSFLLALQNRHYKSYAKAALGDSDLSSPEGFSFIYHLSLVDSYRKMELIKMHHLEPPSGIEVLKRLIKRELIEEFDDPDDGRAKRIRITETGKQEIQTILPKMKHVFSSMTADMSLNEKLHVVSFLQQMNDYHTRKTSKS
ncbi:MAG: winged helix DNA-binding protein [Bacteroidales bacterium]|nr:winged helix DNA-binding protein [Bacteroidales bacterium]